MEVSEATRLNQEVLKNIQISSQENMILKSLEKFYEDISNYNLFIPIVNSQSKISIRLIDHFVTKYSKNNKINYKIKENDIEQTFSIHTSYKQQLKAFQKKHFDPFSRGERIPYFVGDSCVITTIGQLNFFKWFISKKVYDYVYTNQNIIEDDMNRKNKIDKKKKTKEVKIKKNPINYKRSVNNYTNTPILSSYPQPNNTMNFSQPNKIIVSFNFN
jgi:hypothetical protein